MSIVALIHIVFGSLALLSGFVGLAAPKGGRLHSKAGTIFFGSILVMGASGALIAAFVPERGTAVIGILTCYLAATSWWTARHRDGRAGRFELAAFGVALACGSLMAAFVFLAMNSPTGLLDSLPASAHFPFAIVMAIAAAGDLNFLLRRTLSGRQRIVRHLWRMCAALLIAAASFFLGQQDEFPDALKGLAIWFVPPLATLLAMIFWIFRVRFAKAWAWAVPRRRTADGAAAAADLKPKAALSG